MYGPSQILHSDQSHNFKSTIFSKVLDAFGMHKLHTTSYQSPGDGIVERFNQTMLQLLKAYATLQHDW